MVITYNCLTHADCFKCIVFEAYTVNEIEMKYC